MINNNRYRVRGRLSGGQAYSNIIIANISIYLIVTTTALSVSQRQPVTIPMPLTATAEVL